MTGADVVTTARGLADGGGWAPDRTAAVTVAFTPGSVSLSAHTLTAAGYEWGRAHRNDADGGLSGGGDDAGGIAGLYDRVQLLLSDKFVGVFLVPDDGGRRRRGGGVELQLYGGALQRGRGLCGAAGRAAPVLRRGPPADALSQLCGGRGGGRGGAGD
eukprot:TRINITY_DN1834_c0_g1_i3.p1 TRINITY_DN1834_c0_g1~~TRINITY_DN1834_c0_g1_i3.p1  ORF type:complete len:170 (+),score=33.62 TRINITY_DN1834_c0_g1_i3:39-512(+)